MMPPLFYARAMLRKMSFVPDGEGRTAISHQENRSCFFKERNVKYIQKFKLKENCAAHWNLRAPLEKA